MNHLFWAMFALLWAIYKVVCIVMSIPTPSIGWKLWNGVIAVIMLGFFILTLVEWKNS